MNFFHSVCSGIGFVFLGIGSVVLIVSGTAAGYSVAYGDTVDIYVSNPFGGTQYFYISGPNFPFTQMMDSNGDKIKVEGRGRTKTIETSDIRSVNGKRPDVGTYTIYIYKEDGCTSPRDLNYEYTQIESLTLRPLSVSVNSVTTVSPTVEITVIKTAEPTPVPTVVSTTIPSVSPSSPLPLIPVFAGVMVGGIIMGGRIKRK